MQPPTNSATENLNLPNLRFPEFTDEWELKKLGEVAEISSGGTPSRTNQNYWNGNIPWISTTLIDFNFIDKTEEYITQEGLKNSSAKLFPVGTLLMAMYGQGKTRGKIAVLNIESTTNQACGAIITNSKRLNSLFAFQNLSKRYDEIRDLSNQGGQENLSGGILKGIEISFPTLPEQQKIATFLAAIDEKLQALKQKKTLLDQYKKGVMQQIFSQVLRFKDDDGNTFMDWEEKKIKEIFKFRQGIQCGVDNQFLEKSENMVRFIRIIDLTNSNEPIRYIKSIGDGNVLTQDDLFMVRYGNAGLVGYGYEGTIANNLFRIIPTTNVINKFYYYVFGFLEKELSNLAGSSTMPALNFSSLSLLKIPFLSLEEQTKIANFLSAIDDKINHCQAQIEKTTVWKKGLLQQMFV